MGLFGSRFVKWIWPDIEVRAVMLGLDAAGKSTILYKLKLGEIVNTIPTIGFNVETVEVGNVQMTVWDVGGQSTIRPLWKYYFRNAKAIIFVVDSTDVERMDEARQELDLLLGDPELAGAHLLVLANKSDLSMAKGEGYIAEKLKLHSIMDRKWFCHSTSAVRGEGIMESFLWLQKQIRNE